MNKFLLEHLRWTIIAHVVGGGSGDDIPRPKKAATKNLKDKPKPHLEPDEEL